MWVGVLELTLSIYAESLKDKRSVVKRVSQRCRNEFNVSVAEVDEQDTATTAVLGVVSVGSDRRYLEGQLNKLEDFVERLEVAEIADAVVAFEKF